LDLAIAGGHGTAPDDSFGQSTPPKPNYHYCVKRQVFCKSGFRRSSSDTVLDVGRFTLEAGSFCFFLGLRLAFKSLDLFLNLLLRLLDIRFDFALIDRHVDIDLVALRVRAGFRQAEPPQIEPDSNQADQEHSQQLKQ
jgi:hypothetical protein